MSERPILGINGASGHNVATRPSLQSRNSGMCYADTYSLVYKPLDGGMSAVVQDQSAIRTLWGKLSELYHASTLAGDNAAQYWADIQVNSKSPLAPLAAVPGVLAALWTPEVAPTTALTLGTAGYGFAALPKNLIHFTTAAGAEGIAASGAINATRIGLFGPGVYTTLIGRPLNLFVRANARVPILLATPAGTVRIIPKLIYVRWGLAPAALP
jgi:hypothetical protein